jgi:alcohol dehydrogenase
MEGEWPKVSLMKAIHFTQFQGELSVLELPMPQVSDKGVVIKVEATGLCRSDWHGWMGHDSDIALPHVPGHELAGIISEVGSAVKKYAVGDRVTVPFVCGCGDCELCLQGDAQICPTQTQPGFTGFGSFAEYVAIENADFNLISLPSEISFSTAAALGCRFATAFRGLAKRAEVAPGETVIIYGCGGVGLSAIMIAKSLGAVVYAVDVSDTALELADRLGAIPINSKEVDPVTYIQDLGGAQIAVDALGSEVTAGQSVMSLRRRGRHLQLGLMLTPSGLSAMPMARVIAWELDILGSHGMAARDYPEMLAMVAAGTLNPSLLVTRKVGLAQGAAALRDMGTSTLVAAGITVITPAS